MSTALNAFVTTGTATYPVSPVDASLAEQVGCPTATHRLEGRETVYGYFMATGTVPGKSVRVPGWSTARKGVRAVFVPAVLDETVDWGSPVDGWLGE
jgi:hypothetical protein